MTDYYRRLVDDLEEAEEAASTAMRRADIAVDQMTILNEALRAGDPAGHLVRMGWTPEKAQADVAGAGEGYSAHQVASAREARTDLSHARTRARKALRRVQGGGR